MFEQFSGFNTFTNVPVIVNYSFKIDPYDLEVQRVQKRYEDEHTPEISECELEEGYYDHSEADVNYDELCLHDTEREQVTIMDEEDEETENEDEGASSKINN